MMKEPAMYKLELHCHNREVSACATASARELVDAYRAAGYSGVVSTNHINRGTYGGMEDAPWEKKAERFIRGYEALKTAAGRDLDVLLGCEINLSPVEPLPGEYLSRGWMHYYPNDYLVYGVTEKWLFETGDVRRMSLEALSQSVRAAGLLLVHAHPFRCDTVMQDPRYFDGYEVFNGNLRHDSHNDLANAWAEMKRKIKTSGSDYHRSDDPACGGILTDERVRDNGELLRVLREGRYTLLR
ncbi:MAG: PHP domain-containing protein [Clostridia bacterium]|nr:PHP domain-containing protein [Clostridia bacterium]